MGVARPIPNRPQVGNLPHNTSAGFIPFGGPQANVDSQDRLVHKVLLLSPLLYRRYRCLRGSRQINRRHQAETPVAL